MPETPDCAEIRPLLAELSAGVLSGEYRAMVLGHLCGCAACRHESAVLAMIADEMLALAPVREPPAGFESGVLRRVVPRGRPMVRAALAVAAALLAVLPALAVWHATADDRRLAAQQRRTRAAASGLAIRPLMAGTERAGRVIACQGSPSWVLVVVQHGTTTEPYSIELVTRDGRRVPIGTMNVRTGAGSWGHTLDVQVADLVQVRLTGPDRTALSATFVRPPAGP